MAEVVLRLLQLLVLALLWGFVLLTVRALRADLRAAGRPAVPAEAAPARPARRGLAGRQRREEQERRPVRRLVVTEGSLRGTSLELTDTAVTIGRADGATLVLADDYASGRHARLLPDGTGRWLVEDLGSTNGTFLRGERLQAPTPLPLNAPLRIGRTVLELRA